MPIIDRQQRRIERANLSASSQKAREWIQKKADELRGSNRRDLLRDSKRKETSFQLGAMYFFVYNPKMKDTLPKYDLFPLVIPFDRFGDGFLGINLHYLSVGARAGLLNKLSVFTNDNKYDEKTRFTFTYAILKGLSIDASPAIKKYLTSNIRSRFIKIDASEWDIAISLPVESFIYPAKNKYESPV
jgi:hypothetical protein